LRAAPRRTDAYPLSDQANAKDWTPVGSASDEFNGGSVDSSKWSLSIDDWKGGKPAWFNPQNVSVSGGFLDMKLRYEATPQHLSAQGFHTYSSAVMISRQKYKYGYFEARIKGMKTRGCSAFWLYANQGPHWNEIDIMEMGGTAPGEPQQYYQTVHVFRSPQQSKHWQIVRTYQHSANLYDDFHTYGLEWDVDFIRFYFNGVLVTQGPNTHWHQPLNLVLDVDLIPGWFGLPNPGELPASMKVDYVRAWTKA
jgi:beta-glucanase (GH16 family)